MGKSDDKSLDCDDDMFLSCCLVQTKVCLLEGLGNKIRDIGGECSHDSKITLMEQFWLCQG